MRGKFTGRLNVVLLGSTGSIGKSTLEVLEFHSDNFRVLALAAGANSALLESQIKRHRPEYVALADGTAEVGDAQLVDTEDPLTTLATLEEADIIVIATSGHVAIPATLAALEAGKIVALANKEVIVAAGHLAIEAARRGGGTIRPVDSEHSAIWQCLESDAFDLQQVERIILTASGGPFRERTRDELREVSAAEALNHPTWSMGNRITIDSATLMNKGFELIEAAWLFGCPIDKLDVLIHPQSIVHSFVEYKDGSLIAQLGSHDMRVPIQYALTYPRRLPGPGRQLLPSELSELAFEEPDIERFPALRLAREAAQAGGTYPVVLSTIDELAVRAFLDGHIRFLDIDRLVETALTDHKSVSETPSLGEILELDRALRQEFDSLLARSSHH